MKILHVFYDITELSGYQIRSKYILANQEKMGLEVRAAYLPIRASNRIEKVLGGVSVFPLEIPAKSRRLFAADATGFLLGSAQRALMRRHFRTYLLRLISERRPDIVHAHSAWMSALPALVAARAASLPFLYEVRGLWEETGVAERNTSRHGLKYWYFRLNENHLIHGSDRIVALSHGLKTELIKRGGNSDRIDVIPNGVDIDDFAPLPRDSELAESLGCGRQTIVGFVSTLRKLEGVEYLIKAMQKVNERVAAIVVGDGPEKARLEKLARDLRMQDRIKFPGAVPHSEIKRYYSIIDIFVVPRIREKVCEIVTPLKPLEAMAMGKCVVMSDVGGLRELANENETAVFFQPENYSDLAEKLNGLIADKQLRQSLGEKARKYVVEKKDWHKLVKAYIPIYQRLVK